MSNTNRTEQNVIHRRRRRRALPPGWRILDGMGQPAKALCVDPVIEQTRDVAHALFAAGVVGPSVGFRRYAHDAIEAWTAHALRRGDAGLARILEALDVETFAETWGQLVRRLDRDGTTETLEWIYRRHGGKP